MSDVEYSGYKIAIEQDKDADKSVEEISSVIATVKSSWDIQVDRDKLAKYIKSLKAKESA